MRDSSAQRRRHVVVLIDLVGDTGGAESIAAELLLRLDAARFRRTLVLYRTCVPGSDAEASQARTVARLREDGVAIMQLHRGGRFDLAAWRPFVRLLRSGDVDVLHSHKYGPNLWASLFSRVWRVPAVIAHEHGWAYQGWPGRRLADRWLIATSSDAFVAVSEPNRRRMIALEHIPPARVRLMPNGIPAPEPPGGPDVRAELGLPPDARLVGSVGIFRAEKDFPLLVEAHERIRARVPDSHLVLVGDGPTRPAVEKAVARLGATDHVHLPGLRADATRYIAAVDVAVNSSLFEGSSLAVLEYMAMARPIVATAVGGTPDLLGHGEAGILVPPSDPGALADAVATLLLDPDAARALGERALARQRREYDISVQVDRLVSLYEELLDGNRPATAA